MKALAKLCKKWQKILRLEDWDVDIELCDDMTYQMYEAQLEYDLGSSTGHYCAFPDRNFALVRIKASDHEGLLAIEETLVHEMIHLRVQDSKIFSFELIEKIPSLDLQEMMQDKAVEVNEHIVHMLSRAFLALDRR